MCGERHLSFLVAVGVVLPAEGDFAVLKAQQPVIGNRHAMGIASQIMQHVFGTAERLLGIDHHLWRWSDRRYWANARGSATDWSAPWKRSLCPRNKFFNSSTNLPRKTSLSASTGKKKRYLGWIQRDRSAAKPPSGTT